MIRSKKLAFVSFLAVFLLGMVLGVVLERFVFSADYHGRRRHGPSEYLFNKFSKELALDEEQKNQLEKLLKEIGDKHRRIRDANKQQYAKIRSEFDASFRQVLTHDQLEKYERLVQEFEAARKRYRQKHERHK